MLNTIKYTIAEMIRMPGIMIWSLLFPLILMSVFSLMFGPLDELSSFDPIRVAVVEDSDSEGTAISPEQKAFDAFMEAVSTGEDRILDTEIVASPEAAEQLVRDSQTDVSPVIGYIDFTDDAPQLHISGALSSQNTEHTQAQVLMMVMDEYTSRAQLLKDLAENNPAALTNPDVLDSLSQDFDATTQIDVTRNQPKESVRYYFALLGMAALFGGSVSLVAFQRMRPNLSALGARRSVGGISHGKAVLATLIGCWIINFVCLTIAYLAMRFFIGIDFGGRDLACLAVTAAASFTSLSLGCAVSAIPNMPENGKSGLLTGIVCFAALFAGLYGQPTMALADNIAANAPWAAWINPAAQISQAFYSIMYYDSLAPLLSHIAALLIMAVILFALSVSSLRRQRYASI